VVPDTPSWKEAAMNDGKSIPKRFLGSSGIEVSAIGLGCMSLDEQR
jgi:hypothetical protein